MSNPYEDSVNFNHRLTVETTFSEGDVRDHREGFSQREYFRNNQATPLQTEGGGFQPMDSVTQPPKPKGGTKQVSPKPKTKKDQALEAANKKDLQQRNIK